MIQSTTTERESSKLASVSTDQTVMAAKPVETSKRETVISLERRLEIWSKLGLKMNCGNG